MKLSEKTGTIFSGMDEGNEKTVHNQV